MHEGFRSTSRKSQASLGGQMIPATRHRIIVRLSLLLLIGQSACAVHVNSAPEAYKRASNSGSAEKSYKSESKSSASEKMEAILGEKAVRTPAQQKINSQLLYELKMHRGEAIAPGVKTLRTGVKVEADGTTLVDIKAEVTEEVLARIEALGGKVMSSFPQYQAIRARIPLDQIEALAEMQEVIFIRPADEPMMN